MLRLVLFLSILQLALSACPADFDLVKDGECRGNLRDTLETDTCKVGSRNSGSDCGRCCTDESLTPFMIRNDEDQSYWARRAKLDESTIKLAIYCNTLSRRWEWYDGTPVDYRPPLYDQALDKNCIDDGTDPKPVGGGFYLTKDDGKWNRKSGKGDTVRVYCTGRVDRLPVRDDSLSQNPLDGLLYQIGSTANNWQDAQDACKKQEADLVTIHNQQANSFVRQLAISKDASNGIFIGASLVDGNLTWSDGTDWDYANADTESLSSGDGDCMAMDTFSYTGQWFGTDCASPLPYACVKSDPMLTGPWEAGKDITSPGYPYDASIPADYLLTVTTGFVEVTIEELQANSCCDFLFLSDQEKGGKLVAKLTGQLLPENRDKNKFTSKSNFMKVSWQPNGAKSVKGFRLTYRSVPTQPTTSASTMKAPLTTLKTSASANIIQRLSRRQQFSPQQLQLQQQLGEQIQHRGQLEHP